MPSAIVKTVALGMPWVTLDPFLFCVHHHDAYPEGNASMGPAAPLTGRNLGQDFEGREGWNMYHGHTVPGFPQHPHRGFETVTIARQGFIDHSDSLGATARFGAGDTQWLTAGKGIVHCEMFPLREEKKKNPAELFQIWLNLPAANKMVEPHFSMFWNEKTPRHLFHDAKGRATEVMVLAGALGAVKALPPPPKSWASNPKSDLAIWTVRLGAHAEATLPAAKPGTNRMLYVHGSTPVRIDGTLVQPNTGVQVKPEVPIALVGGDGVGELLLLQGQPIGEPVVSYGPFVMNTREEIQAAFADYQRTQFGGWPWRRDDPVHPRETGRFAKHADGRVEKA